MPRIEAFSHKPLTKLLKAVLPNGTIIEGVTGFDTDEKWIEKFDFETQESFDEIGVNWEQKEDGRLVRQRNLPGKIKIRNGKLQVIRNHTDFDIIDKISGTVLWSVRL